MGNELKLKISDFRPITGYADYVKRNARDIGSEFSSYNSKEMFLFCYNLSLLAAGVVIITGLEKLIQK